VQVPSEDVTVVLPSDVDEDMLVAPLPVVECTVPFGKVVLPDTFPPPAVTWLLIVPEPEGGCSPGLRCTILQF
jgi:hypothetical protein